MAAVIADAHGIFAWGWNNTWTHCEEHAIRRANPRRLIGSTIYVAGRRASSGNLVLARPCNKPHKSCWNRCTAWGLNIKYLDKSGTWRSV